MKKIIIIVILVLSVGLIGTGLFFTFTDKENKNKNSDIIYSNEGIVDVDKELELVNETKLENMELYGFGGSHESEEDAETTGQSDRNN